ncbi:unnamed protein product [Amoebophrya sp. A120]|nr:unnamed protein product [Amoebophrya sp. A120]|eukprot:GSA120T00013573001.1
MMQGLRCSLDKMKENAQSCRAHYQAAASICHVVTQFALGLLIMEGVAVVQKIFMRRMATCHPQLSITIFQTQTYFQRIAHFPNMMSLTLY